MSEEVAKYRATLVAKLVAEGNVITYTPLTYEELFAFGHNTHPVQTQHPDVVAVSSATGASRNRLCNRDHRLILAPYNIDETGPANSLRHLATRTLIHVCDFVATNVQLGSSIAEGTKVMVYADSKGDTTEQPWDGTSNLQAHAIIRKKTDTKTP